MHQTARRSIAVSLGGQMCFETNSGCVIGWLLGGWLSWGFGGYTANLGLPVIFLKNFVTTLAHGNRVVVYGRKA